MQFSGMSGWIAIAEQTFAGLTIGEVLIRAFRPCGTGYHSLPHDRAPVPLISPPQNLADCRILDTRLEATRVPPGLVDFLNLLGGCLLASACLPILPYSGGPRSPLVS